MPRCPKEHLRIKTSVFYQVARGGVIHYFPMHPEGFNIWKRYINSYFLDYMYLQTENPYNHSVQVLTGSRQLPQGKPQEHLMTGTPEACFTRKRISLQQIKFANYVKIYVHGHRCVRFSANGVHESLAWTQSEQSTSPLKSESATSSVNDLTCSLLPVTEEISIGSPKGFKRIQHPPSFLQ